MLEIDGSRYSGSGSIVRQAVAFAALTGRAIRVFHVRARRPNPGLRPQHIRAVEAISQLVGGRIEGVHPSSQEFFFQPGVDRGAEPSYVWDVGSAGSTTMLALAVLPVLAFRPTPVRVELRGGLFQDFAPSFYHLQHVVLPLLRGMGFQAEVEMGRPGYVPRGEGILYLSVWPVRGELQPLVLHPSSQNVEKIWGIALASHLEERRVSHRMAEAARKSLAASGYGCVEVELLYDRTALQPGAALALFADLQGGVRLGADQAGAPRRRAESIGHFVAGQLLEDLRSGATLDRHAADQVIPFAALAKGESRFSIPHVTDHIQSGAWLAREFLGAEVRVEGRWLTVRGVGFKP